MAGMRAGEFLTNLLHRLCEALRSAIEAPSILVFCLAMLAQLQLRGRGLCELFLLSPLNLTSTTPPPPDRGGHYCVAKRPVASCNEC